MLHKFLAKLLGRNLESTPLNVIVDQMNEMRPLPMGMTEFDEWSTRIISGAMCSATPESQRYVLANMLLHLGPTEDHKPDAFFIKSLRKFAINEVADAVRRDIYDRRKQKPEETTVQ